MLRDSHSRRSFLAPILIFFIGVLFGLFWYWQRGELVKNESMIVLSNQPNSAQTTPSQRPPALDIESLQASAVSIPIPSFEDLF